MKLHVWHSFTIYIRLHSPYNGSNRRMDAKTSLERAACSSDYKIQIYANLFKLYILLHFRRQAAITSDYSRLPSTIGVKLALKG